MTSVLLTLSTRLLMDNWTLGKQRRKGKRVYLVVVLHWSDVLNLSLNFPIGKSRRTSTLQGWPAATREPRVPVTIYHALFGWKPPPPPKKKVCICRRRRTRSGFSPFTHPVPSISDHLVKEKGRKREGSTIIQYKTKIKR